MDTTSAGPVSPNESTTCLKELRAKKALFDYSFVCSFFHSLNSLIRIDFLFPDLVEIDSPTNACHG